MFFDVRNPVEIKENEIRIYTKKLKKKLPIELTPIIKLMNKFPEIVVYENDSEIIRYSIEPKDENQNLEGQFIHLSIRILDNFAFMMDGIISVSNYEINDPTKIDVEGIRFQTTFIGENSLITKTLVGKGLFARGLHYSGIITPGNVRLCCVCDYCKKPFNIQSFHAGFGNGQYFYSTDSSETLFVNNGEIDNIPAQLQTKIDLDLLSIAEEKLPKAKSGTFKYYNPFRCPHCKQKYIDFENHPEIRSDEYYGNTYLNQKIRNLTTAST